MKNISLEKNNTDRKGSWGLGTHILGMIPFCKELRLLERTPLIGLFLNCIPSDS